MHGIRELRKERLVRGDAAEDQVVTSSCITDSRLHAGLARVDFFVSRADGALYVNEVNTLPGFTAVSRCQPENSTRNVNPINDEPSGYPQTDDF